MIIVTLVVMLFLMPDAECASSQLLPGDSTGDRLSESGFAGNRTIKKGAGSLVSHNHFDESN